MTDLNQEIDMESKEKNTKEKILEEALKLFAQTTRRSKEKLNKPNNEPLLADELY